MFTDVLVIGTGISGLSYSIKLATLSPKTKITLICKNSIYDGNTRYAQGGIAVVSNFKKDSYEKHIQDTLEAGDFENNKEVVEFVVKEGNSRLDELIQWGAEFDKKSKNKLDLVKEGGHSEKRIIHHKDHSGFEIQRALINKIKELPNIEYNESHILVDLITEHHSPSLPKRCYGAYIISTENEKVIKIISKITVLSTGGAGQLYEFTTNVKGATADGLGAAYRAKVNLVGLPYIQFHPTALYYKVKDEVFLISEAVRGAGAILKNDKGEAFMAKYHPKKDLAPRDIVARAIAIEIKKSSKPFVYLDATGIEKTYFENHFPMILETCKKAGFNPLKKFIPIVSAAHYSCGGIEVNEWGQSSLEGLYAIGECSFTGLHGANRLASNSLLESLVFAHRAAISSVAMLQENKLNSTLNNQIPDWKGQKVSTTDNTKIAEAIILEVENIMSTYVGIYKTTEGLEKASDLIHTLYIKTITLYNHNKLTPRVCELRNMVSIAYLIIRQSIEIKNNKGVFYNENYS